MPAQSDSKGRRLVAELPNGRMSEPLRGDVCEQVVRFGQVCAAVSDRAVLYVEVGE